MGAASDGIRLLRPKQWTKNVFVFAPFIFTQGWREPRTFALAVAGFVAMCLASSATYVANDLLDAEADRAHPKKRHRPIASGRVSPRTAATAAAALAFASLAIAWGLAFVKPVAAYLVLQVLYNLRLKREAVADVATIASGFVLRVMAGASAIKAPVSAWILLCTGFLALVLGFGKRRHELMLLGGGVAETRKALHGYSVASLDILLGFSAAGAALSFAVYSIESRTARQYPGLFLTSPFVVYGIARYLVLVYANDEGGEPENLVVGDVQLALALVGFLVAAILALSGFRVGLVR